MHGVTPSTRTRNAKVLAALASVAVAVLPLLAACSDSEPAAPGEVPQSPQAQQGDIKHGPFFPQCGGISDQTISQLTEVPGLVNTATTSVGCQWLAGGSIVGPHFSFTHFRGSPIGRERKTEELSRTSVEDINIEGHDGFIATGDDLTLGTNLCEIGIQFDNDFIEWSVSFAEKPFPDPCEVAKELTRQSIVNSR
ncbi:DUF3558 domain-containing protein [Mycolicibacterium litorale]|uniref:DUF3558 domain-containing protein n=1 Tax=Mycolicibacterium litorale TaxID=758802 RepID=UPI0010EAB0D0|nr:DUF3558 domain-containing protein [Mycolicibacterium litorale]MCV7414648.1 DUF3558 domain-containing protein [Mycolicibacterium litorale]TDY00856.1 uncharacterized protein DUF3558 [Mycolicibacterium litorale]